MIFQTLDNHEYLPTYNDSSISFLLLSIHSYSQQKTVTHDITENLTTYLYEYVEVDTVCYE